MLYGHIEQAYHRIDHLIRLRELQDETGGFQTFIPLAFHPDNTGLSHIKKPSSLDGPADDGGLRLMLDNIAHQGLLDHARHRHGAGRAGLRRRRHRRHRAA
jgi:aminodeoxyfutalosine synthase